MSTGRHRVVIVGAGHGGIEAAKALGNADVDVTIIDKNNYHTFQALLYQVATAGLELGAIAYQVRGVLRRYPNVRFRLGRVLDIDVDAKHVALEGGDTIPYDSLIVAAGAVYDDLGVPGVRDNAFVLKSLRESIALRSHSLHQFERAARHPERIGDGRLTFVIVGAGPTGVEMAGALVELFAVAAKDYPELATLETGRPKVIVLEALDQVLAMFSEKAQRYTADVLRRRGVEVRLSTRVTKVEPGYVELEDGERIPTQTLIWTAGVRAHPLAEALGIELMRGYRVPVTPQGHLEGRPEAFVIGDMSGMLAPNGEVYPMVAQVAMQQAKHAARLIKARLAGEDDTAPFHYRDRGMMAIIGRGAGVAEMSKRLGGMRFTGFIGWLAWLFIHLIYLPGHQNRISAFFSWLSNFFTFDRHARLQLSKPDETGHIRRSSGSMPR